MCTSTYVIIRSQWFKQRCTIFQLALLMFLLVCFNSTAGSHWATMSENAISKDYEKDRHLKKPNKLQYTRFQKCAGRKCFDYLCCGPCCLYHIRWLSWKQHIGQKLDNWKNHIMMNQLVNAITLISMNAGWRYIKSEMETICGCVQGEMTDGNPIYFDWHTYMMRLIHHWWCV